MINLFTSCLKIHFSFFLFFSICAAEVSIKFTFLRSKFYSEILKNGIHYSRKCCRSPLNALGLPWHITFLEMHSPITAIRISFSLALPLLQEICPLIQHLSQSTYIKDIDENVFSPGRQKLSFFLSVTSIKLYTSRLDLDKYLMNWMNSVLF